MRQATPVPGEVQTTMTYTARMVVVKKKNKQKKK